MNNLTTNPTIRIRLIIPNALMVIIHFLLIFNAIAQETVLTQNIEIGRKLTSNEVIKANETKLSERIDDVNFDSSRHYITFQTRGLSANGKWLQNTGQMIVFDQQRNAVKWSDEVNYLSTSTTQVNGNILIGKPNNTIGISLETGEEIWKKKTILYYTDYKTGIALGYQFKNSTGISSTLQGINTTTGEVIWTKELDHSFGWNQIKHINDSILLIASSGLHQINLNTGKGWSYYTPTGDKDYTGAIATNVAGAAVGLLTGSFFFSTGGADVVRGNVSNILQIDSSFYLATKEKICRLNNNGATQWFERFPEISAGKSHLFERDSLVYMLNLGFAYKNGRRINYGSPFLAAYHKTTGKRLLIKALGGELEVVSDFMLKNQNLILLGNKSIITIDLDRGEIINKFAFPIETLGKPDYFLDSEIAHQQLDGRFKSMKEVDSTALFVVNAKDEIIWLSNEFEVKKTLNLNEFYFKIPLTDSISLFNHEEKTILAKNQQAIAMVDKLKRPFVWWNHLYAINDNVLLEISLEEL